MRWRLLHWGTGAKGHHQAIISVPHENELLPYPGLDQKRAGEPWRGVRGVGTKVGMISRGKGAESAHSPPSKHARHNACNVQAASRLRACLLLSSATRSVGAALCFPCAFSTCMWIPSLCILHMPACRFTCMLCLATHTHTCTCTHTAAHAHMHMHAHARPHTHTRMHTHTHSRTLFHTCR